jgi:hypothetical protein
VLVATVLAAATACDGSSPGPPARSTTATTPKSAAIARIDRLLATAPLPPGARKASNTLTARFGFETSMSPNEIRKRGTWTAPGTISSVVRAIDGQPVPAGLVLVCRACGHRVDFYSASASEQLEVNYVVAPYRDGVLVRVDVWTVWKPVRPAWSRLTGTVISVDIVIQRLVRTSDLPAVPTVRRSITGRAAERLARALDAVPTVAPQGHHSCPYLAVLPDDRAVFHTRNGRYELTAPAFCSGRDTLLSATYHSAGITLDGDAADQALLAAVGLPSDYGSQ